jgi:outer membrane protein assembly factor BamE (lipoprotein component of BamABCDE complex)
MIANPLTRLFFAVCLLPFLAGCLISSNSKQSTTGNYVPENTFDQIEPGKTTAGWVKATLGEPSSKTKVEGSTSEIWKWSYTEKKESGGAVFLIFGGHSEDQTTHAAYVELQDGVVVKKWRG